MKEMETLNLGDVDALCRTGKALSSEIRIKLLTLLYHGEKNVNEIAKALQIPSSSAAIHVKALEEAAFITTTLRPAARGSMKICSLNLKALDIQLVPPAAKSNSDTISMPIGNYVDYQVTPTCGMVNEHGYIDEEDEPRCFYNPMRTTAKLLWFGSGYVEYRFANNLLEKRTIKSLEFSAELCSETADYNMDFPSDISLVINDIIAGTWCCPSDFGGRRGQLNPSWWPDKNSQYGRLKTWKITNTGTYLDNILVSPYTLEDFALTRDPFISVRIEILPDSACKGGINIFGKDFGDYPQDILLTFHYEDS